MSDKITAEHQARIAYVYVRQSSGHQVRNHQEGQRRQYGLQQRASSLGFTQTIIIDDDLGRSGSGLAARPGFARLLAAICEGTAGAVLSLEASRLARNNRDWHHLIDLCALTGTLIIDEDGIYDPRQINDRLLLGLKGTMSEFELSLFRQRARLAFEQKIKRGHTMWEVPVGFVRTEDDTVEKIADMQVQEAIAGVFKKFRELGSARQTMLWYRDQEVPLPEASAGTSGRQISWRLPGNGRIRQILKNPCYAGALAYGRSAARVQMQDGRPRQSSRRRKPVQEWNVLMIGHHQGYITWDEYLENQQRLEANVIMEPGGSGGAARKGPALLSGLLRCGKCGRQLRVIYSGQKGRTGRYACNGGRVNRGNAACLALGALRVDRAVADKVLEAIQPAGIEAALLACREQAGEQAEKQRALQLTLEKAYYENSRARRQYDAVDPENRLVAGVLEQRWNETLSRVEEIKQQLSQLALPQAAFNEEQKQRLLRLGSNVAVLWRNPAAPIELKKRIMRTVLKEIIITAGDDPPGYHLALHWQGGVHTRLSVPRNLAGQHGRTTNHNVIELIQELSKVCDDQAIAATLNRLGYRTGTGKTWRRYSIWNIRWYYRLPNFANSGDWLTIQQTSETLQVSHTVIRRLIREKILPAVQLVESTPWIIARVDLDRPEVQSQITAVKTGRQLPSISPAQLELPWQ